MDDETLYTIALHIAVLFFIVILGYYKRLNWVANSLILIFYSTIFYYLIFNKGEGGGSFYWLFLLWIATLIHIIFLVVQLFFSFRDEHSE